MEKIDPKKNLRDFSQQDLVSMSGFTDETEINSSYWSDKEYQKVIDLIEQGHLIKKISDELGRPFG